MDPEHYPRVSTILRDMGLVRPYPEGVPAVEWGRARGTAVHKAIHLYEQGLLDPLTLHADVAGPFQSYLAFKKDTGYEPEAVEEPVVSTRLRVRGTPDTYGPFPTERAILDVKCSKQPDFEGAAFQLAAYALALAEPYTCRMCVSAAQFGPCTCLPLALPRRYVLQLGDESYRVHDVTSAEAASIFEAACRVWWAQRTKLVLP